MEILVINLMRLGDLIQASALLRRLRSEYPGARITLLVLDVFKDAALLLDGVDGLILFPSLRLAGGLDEPGNWPEAFLVLRTWFNENFSHPPDMVINLTPNLLGGILALAARGREMRGFAMDKARGGYTSSFWASYGLVVSKARQANPFNLADMFVRGAGLMPNGAGLRVNIPRTAQAEADAAIQALGLAPETALVGILPGASQPERQWPPESFARTARLLRQARPCHFFIFGSSQEEPLGEVIRSHLPGTEVTQCQGRTSLPVLAAYLKRLDLLLSNDTGPMHLAAAVGAPVLTIFLASARVLDTGPTGKGHIAIEPGLTCHPCPAPCSHPRCQAVITPKAVAGWGLHLLAKEPGNQLFEVADEEDLRVYYADVDPLGYQVYLPLVRRPLDRRAFWLWTNRLAWAEILDSHHPLRQLCRWVKDILARHYLPPGGDLGGTAGQQALAETMRLAAQGKEAARQIIKLADSGPTAVARLKQKMENFAAIDLHLRRLALEFPEGASLIEFFFQEQRQYGDSRMVPLARELARAYDSLYRLGAIFRKVARELAPTAGAPSGVAQEMQNNSEISRNYRQDLEWPHAGDYQ